METTFLGLRTTIYRVTDLTRAKAWYAEAFNTQPYFDEPFYVGFEIAGYELGLQPAEGEKNQAGGVETYWGVSNLKEVYDRLISLGATPYEPPRNVGGPIEVATVLDPWENIIGIIYNPLFKK